MPDKKTRMEDQWAKNFMSSVFRDIENSHQVILERTWFRNILYYLGEQWLVWLESNATFGHRYGLQYGVPTPVSNIIREYVRSIKALFLNKQYKAIIWPNSMELEDRDGAETGNAVLEWLNTRNDKEIEDIKEDLPLWLSLTGNAFTRTFPEIDGNGFVLDAAGNSTKKADVCVDVVIPFNIRVSPLGSRLRQKRWVGCKTLAYREWVEDTYKVTLPKEATDYRQVDYQRQLMSLVATVSPWKGRSLENMIINDDTCDDMVIVQEVEWRPDAKFPKGQYMAAVDGKILVNNDQLPMPVRDGNWFYTFDHFHYNRTPGGFWCTGGVDDLISPQNTINEVDQALAINRKSLGRPRILTPSDLVLKRLSERGQALLAIQYDSKSALGTKPEFQPGTPYPNQILEERAIQRGVAQDAGGDPKNVLRGSAPYAGAPGVAIDILRETAEQGHAPDINAFYRTWNRVEKKRLVLVQELFTDSRLIKIQGKGNDVRIFNFKSSDLHGNVDVHLELDSGLSSTNVGKNQFMLQLIQYGFWDPNRGPKPDVRREMLYRFGMAGFPEEENLHKDRAEYENSMILAGKDVESIALPPMPTGEEDPNNPGQELMVEQDDPVFELDDHYSHVQTHDQLILSREFRALKKETQMLAIFHREYHAAKLTEQEMSAQTLQMAQGQAQGMREGVMQQEGIPQPGAPEQGGL